VEGTVTKDGRPLANVRVVFLADTGSVGPRAAGLTDKAGHYRLRTDYGEDGAVVGKHRVVILDRTTPRMGAVHLSDYGRFPQTPLRAEVHPGRQTLDFDLP
jgi:hypothetical protein